MFGKGKHRGDKHIQGQLSQQNHDTLNSLPTPDCVTLGCRPVKQGRDTVCLYCGTKM